MFQTKVVQKIKTHILCSITFSRKSCRLWDNVEKYGTARQATDDNIIRRMRFACWITKATDTHSECVILIAFPRQQWLRERSSMLRCTYTACLVLCRSTRIKTASWASGCHFLWLPCTCWYCDHITRNFIFVLCPALLNRVVSIFDPLCHYMAFTNYDAANVFAEARRLD